MHRRHGTAAALAAISVSLLLAGCSSSSDSTGTDATASAMPAASASGSREAGLVTLPVRLCLRNNTSDTLELTPTGPYGEFASTSPGQEACFEGDTGAGDPVAAITFPDDSVIYAYGRNPVMGRPDIRLCADQACSTSFAQYDLSENATLRGTVKGVAYAATRLKDADGKKQLILTIG